MLTLARAARHSGEFLVGKEVVENGLSLFGQRGEMPLENETREARALLVNQFIRRLRGTSVEKINDLERMLLVELQAAPHGVQDVLIRDAISVIKARNHVGQVAKSLRLSWADCMRVEAAISELVRHAAANGGALLQTTVFGSHAEIKLKLAAGTHPPDLGVLAALEPLGAYVRTERTEAHVTIDLTIDVGTMPH